MLVNWCGVFASKSLNFTIYRYVRYGSGPFLWRNSTAYRANVAFSLSHLARTKLTPRYNGL